MKSVLWVEDCQKTFHGMLSEVRNSKKYLIECAPNATIASKLLGSKTFDAVIVDIGLPPGKDQYWIDQAQKAYDVGREPRLGLHLIHNSLSQSNQRSANWLHPNQVAIFSVIYNKLLNELLSKIGIKVIRQKFIDMPDDILLSIIDDVIACSKGQPTDSVV